MSATADILIVDDDASLRAALADYLTGAGYAVRTADGGEAMDARLAEAEPDLVVLDVMMPGEDGLSICRRLQQGRAPVLMLSAMGETTDRIVGLEVGAADYLPKPFEPRELLARIRAVLRRPVLVEETADRTLAFEGWSLGTEARRLTDPTGMPVELTGGEFALLLTFLRSAGRILSRDQILENTHGPLAENFDRAVDLAVSRLRRKLERPGQAALIETVRGAGYRFRAPVRR